MEYVMKVTIPQVGALCESLQGRDKGNLYCIVKVLSGEYVMVVDGDNKKLDRPKKKNIKHLHILCGNVANFGINFQDGKVYDSQIAYAIKLFKKETLQKNQQN
jgi:ribosomal protein L14E/L6E/L27E